MICLGCKKDLSTDEFYKHNKRKTGYRAECKLCSKLELRNSRRTRDGLVSKIYNTQKFNSKRRKHCVPSYTLLDLKNYIFNHSEFDILYERWVHSGYLRELVPSIDRIDDAIGYSLDNIQLVSWEENDHKRDEDVRSGKAIDVKRTAVQMFSLDGVFIEEFISQGAASRIKKIPQSNIYSVCNGKRKTAGGFKWRYLKGIR